MAMSVDERALLLSMTDYYPERANNATLPRSAILDCLSSMNSMKWEPLFFLNLEP